MADLNHPWTGYVEPFRIFGNLYFVGTYPASSHLIDTGEGLILIDPGYPQSLYLVLENIHRVGFEPRDIKVIFHTHGHYDHMGATRALVELTGAKTYIGRGDAGFADGTENLTWAEEMGLVYHEAFVPDVLVDDGDVIALGNTRILCKAAPGHTPGTMAIFFDVTDGENTYRAGMHGGVGFNSMKKDWLDSRGLTTQTREQFVPGLERLMEEPVELWLGNHVWNNDTVEKGKRITAEYNPFLDGTAWKKFLLHVRESFLQMLQEE